MMRRLIDALGLTGLLAMAGLLLVAWLQWALVMPIAQERSAIDAQLAQARSVAGKPAGMPVPDNSLANFHAHFAKQGDLTDQLAKLYGIARNHELALTTADYQMSEVANLKLSQYSIVLPLRGSYAQIRGFVDEAMQELGGLAVEQINFRRKQPLDLLVDAELRLSLFNSAQP
jgi:hypothetical protein